MSNPLSCKPHTGRGPGCRITVKKKKKREKKVASYLRKMASIGFFHVTSINVKHHGQALPSWSRFVSVYQNNHNAKGKSFLILKSVLASQRAYSVHAAQEPSPKGSLKDFNQFPIFDIADLQSVLLSAIDPLKGFDLALSALAEWIEDPVVLILRLATRFEPIALRLNRKTKVMLQELCSYEGHFYPKFRGQCPEMQGRLQIESQHLCWQN